MLPPSASLLALLLATITAAAPPPNPTASSNPAPPFSTPICIDSPVWVTPRFFPSNCDFAVLALVSEEVTTHGSTQYEFLAPRAAPTAGLPVIKTPKRYTYKTCTIALVMLGWFEPGELPGVTAGTVWPRSEVTTFNAVLEAVKTVQNTCVEPFLGGATAGGGDNFLSPAGYIGVGSREALGVFIWQTDSYIDREVGRLRNATGGWGVGLGGNQTGLRPALGAAPSTGVGTS